MQKVIFSNPKIESHNVIIANNLKSIQQIVNNNNLDMASKIEKINQLRKKIEIAENAIEDILKNISKNDTATFEHRWGAIIDRITHLDVILNEILVNENSDHFEFCSTYKEIFNFIEWYNVLLYKYNNIELIWIIIDQINKVIKKQWSTDNTYKEFFDQALIEILKLKEVDKSLKISLINKNLSDHFLIGNNEFELKIIFNKINELVKLKIENVTYGKNNVWDIIQQLFKVAMNWKLDNTNTYLDVLKLIENKINGAVKNIIVKVKLINNKPNDDLSPGSNKTITVEVDINNNIKKLNVTIEKISGRIDTINFNNLDKKIIGMNTANTYKDVLDKINLRAKQLFKDLKVDILNKVLDANLSLGTHTIETHISYKKEYEKIDFILEDVILDDNTIISRFENFFKNDYDWAFNTANTGKTVLDRLIKESQNILGQLTFSKRITIKFEEDNLLNKNISANGISGNVEYLINIKIGLNNKKYKLRLKNIIFSRADLTSKLTGLFKVEYDWNMTTDNIGSDVLKKLSAFIKEKLFIKDFNRLNIKLFNSSDNNEKNDEDTTQWKFLIQIDNSSISSSSTILKLKNILLSDKDLFYKIEKYFNYRNNPDEAFNLKGLKGNSTYTDVLNRIKQEAKKEFEKYFSRIKIWKCNDANLQVGDQPDKDMKLFCQIYFGINNQYGKWVSIYFDID